MQISSHKLAVLFLLLLVDQVDYRNVLDEASGCRNQEVFHRDTSIHQRKRNRIESGRATSTIVLEHKHLKIDLASRVLLQHDDLLKYRFKDAAELLYFLVFLDVCLVVHRTEVCLKIANIKDTLLLALGPTESLAGSTLSNLSKVYKIWINLLGEDLR